MTNLRHWFDLVRFMAYSNLKSESTKTYVGIFWWVLDPLLYMTVFYVVFAVLLERRTGDFIAFLLVGLVMFRWISGTVKNCANSILGGRALMQQVYLPKILLPMVGILTDLLKFSVVLMLLIGFLWLRGYGPTEAYLALLPLLLIEFVMLCGLSFIVASVIPVLPDFKYIIDNLILVTLFLSGIFYSGRDLPIEKQDLFYLNPMARLIEAFRTVLIDGQVPDMQFMIYPAVVAIVLLVLGVTIVRALDRKFPTIVREV